MITKEQIQQWLTELGSTSEEVAAKLESLGIKGETVKACACPLTNYLTAKGGVGVAVCQSCVVFNAPDKDTGKRTESLCLQDTSSEEFVLPWAKGIVEFIYDFDENKYPQLVKEET